MKYILINRKNLSVDVSKKPSKKTFAIPSKLKSTFRDLSPLQSLIYYKILYPAKSAEDKKKGIKVTYLLYHPDPWMIAIAYIMWEGIIQGFTWDSTKLLIDSALEKLVSFKLAPNLSSSKRKKSKKSQLGFHWARYGTDGNLQHEMFIGLKSLHEKMSKKERKKIKKSVIKPKKN